MADKGIPEDSSGHVCDLCGATSPSVFCGPCNKRYFCRSCDDMYHTHPKRHAHDRQPLDGAVKDAPLRPPKKRSALRASTDNLEGSATSITEKVKAASCESPGIPTPPPKRRPKIHTPADSPIGSTTSLSSFKDTPTAVDSVPIVPPKRRSRVQTPIEGAPVDGTTGILSSLPEIIIDSSVPVVPPKQKSYIKSPIDITYSNESISKPTFQASEADTFKVPPVPPPRRSHSQTSVEKISTEGITQNIPEGTISPIPPPPRRSRMRTPDSTTSLPSLPDSKEALFSDQGEPVPLPPKRRSHMRTPDSITSLPAMSLDTKAMFTGDSSTVPIPPKRHLKSPDSTISLPTLPDHKESTFLGRSEVPTPPPRKNIRSSSSITSLPNFTVEYTTAPTPPPKRKSRLHTPDSIESLGHWHYDERAVASHSPTPPPRRKKRELEGSNVSLQSPSGHKRECHWSELTKEEQQYYMEMEDSLLRERGILQSSENIVAPPRKGKPESQSALVLSKLSMDEKSATLPRSAEYSQVIKHPTVIAHAALCDEIKDWNKVTSAPDVRRIEPWHEFKQSDVEKAAASDGRKVGTPDTKVSEDFQQTKENIAITSEATAISHSHVHHAHHPAYTIPTLYSLASAHTASCPQCYTSSWSSLTSPPEDWKGKKDEVAMHQYYHVMHDAGMKRSHSAMHEHALMHPGYIPAGTGLYPYGAVPQICPHGHRSPLSYTTDSSSHSSSCHRRPRKKRSGSRKKREKGEHHRPEESRSESEGEIDIQGYTSEETKEATPSQMKSSPAKDTKGELTTWTCKHCTYINPSGSNICEICCKTNFELPVPSKELTERHSLSFGDMELMGVKRKTKCTAQSDTKDLPEDKLITGKVQSEEETSTKTTSTDTYTAEDTSSVAASYLTSGSQGYVTSELATSERELSQAEKEIKRSFSASPSQTGEYKDSSCQTSHESLAEFSSRENLSPAETGRQLRQVMSDVSPQTSPLLARRALRRPTPPPHGFPPIFGKGIGRPHHSLLRSTAHGDLTTASQGLLPHEPVHDSSGYGTTDSLYHSWSHPSLLGDALRGQERGTSPRPLSPRIGETSRVETLSASDDVRIGYSLHRPRSNWESDPGQLSRSTEQIIDHSHQLSEDHSEDLMNLIREAEQYGFTIEDVQVALERCGRDDPLVWLEQNWQAMIENVAALATDYSEDRNRIEIGIISPNEARDALRSHRGDIRLAVLDCVEGRKSKIEELTARGNFNEDDIAEALTANQGNIELAYTDLVKSTLQPFVSLEEEKLIKDSTDIAVTSNLTTIGVDEQVTEIKVDGSLFNNEERKSPSLISKLQSRMTEKEREEREKEFIKLEETESLERSKPIKLDEVTSVMIGKETEISIEEATEVLESSISRPLKLDEIQASKVQESLKETASLDSVTISSKSVESSKGAKYDVKFDDFAATTVAEEVTDETHSLIIPVLPKDHHLDVDQMLPIATGTQKDEQLLYEDNEPELSDKQSYSYMIEDDYKCELKETIKKQTSLEVPSDMDKRIIKKQTSLESAVTVDKEVKKQSSLEFDKTTFREHVTKHASLESIRSENKERFRKQTSLESAKERKPTSVTARPLIAIIPKSSKYEDDFSRVVSSELLAEEFGIIQPGEKAMLLQSPMETSTLEEESQTVSEEKPLPESQVEKMPEPEETKHTDDRYKLITEEQDDDFVDAPGVGQVEDITEFGSDKYGDYGFASPAAQLYASIIQSTNISGPKKKKRTSQQKIGKDDKQKDTLKRDSSKTSAMISPPLTWVSPGRTIISEDKWTVKPASIVSEAITEETSEDISTLPKDQLLTTTTTTTLQEETFCKSTDKIATSALSDTDSLPSDAYTDAFEEPSSPPPFSGYRAFSDTDSLASDAYTDAPEPISPPSYTGYKTLSDTDSLMSDAFIDALEEPSSPPSLPSSKLQFPIDSSIQQIQHDSSTDIKDTLSLDARTKIATEIPQGEALPEVQQEITESEVNVEDVVVENVESWAVASLYESLMSDVIVEKKPSKQKTSKPKSTKVSKVITIKKESALPFTHSDLKSTGEKHTFVTKNDKSIEISKTSIVSSAEKSPTAEKPSETIPYRDISFTVKELDIVKKEKDLPEERKCIQDYTKPKGESDNLVQEKSPEQTEGSFAPDIGISSTQEVVQKQLSEEYQIEQISEIGFEKSLLPEECFEELPAYSEYQTTQADNVTAKQEYLLARWEESDLHHEETLLPEISMDIESLVSGVESSLREITHELELEEDGFQEALSETEYHFNERLPYESTDKIISQESVESLEEAKYDITTEEEITFYDTTRKDVPTSVYTESDKEAALTIDKEIIKHVGTVLDDNTLVMCEEKSVKTKQAETIEDEYSEIQTIREGRKRKIEEGIISTIGEDIQISEIVKTKPEELVDIASNLEHVEKPGSLNKKAIKIDDSTKNEADIEMEKYKEVKLVKLQEKTIKIHDGIKGMKAYLHEPMPKPSTAQVSNIAEQGIKAEIEETVEKMADLEQKSYIDQRLKAKQEEITISLQKETVKVDHITQEGMKAEIVEYVQEKGADAKSTQLSDIAKHSMKAEELENIEIRTNTLTHKPIQITDITKQEDNSELLEYIEGKICTQQILADTIQERMKADMLGYKEGDADTLKTVILEENRFTDLKEPIKVEEYITEEDIQEFSKDKAIIPEQKPVHIDSVTQKGMKVDIVEHTEDTLISVEQKSFHVDIKQEKIVETVECVDKKSISLESKDIQIDDIEKQRGKENIEVKPFDLAQKHFKTDDITKRGMQAEALEYSEKEISLEQKPILVDTLEEQEMTSKGLEYGEAKPISIEAKHFKIDVIQKGMKTDIVEFIEKPLISEQKIVELDTVTEKGMRAEYVEIKPFQVDYVIQKETETDGLDYVEEKSFSLELRQIQIADMKSELKEVVEFNEEKPINIESESFQIDAISQQGRKADTLEFVKGEAIGLEQKSVEVTDVTLQGKKADTLEFVEGEAVGLEHKLVEVTDVTLQEMKADELEFAEGEVIGLEYKSVEVTDVTLQGMKADTLEFVKGEAIGLEQKSVEVTDVTLPEMKADELEFAEGEAIGLEYKSVEVTDITLQGMKADTLEFVEGEAVGLEHKLVEVTDVTLQETKADELEFAEGEAIGLEYKSVEVTDVTLQGMKADTLEFVKGEAIGLEQKSVEVTDVTLPEMKADELEFAEGEAIGLEHKSVEVTDLTLKGMKADILEFVEGEAVGLEHKSVEVTDVTLQGMKADTLQFVEGEAVGLEHKLVEVTDVTLQGMKADTLEFVEREVIGLEHKLVEVTDVTLQGMKADTLEFVEKEAIELEQKSVEVTDVTLQGMKADTLEFVEGEAIELEHKSVEVTDVTLQGMKADTLEFVEGEIIGLEQKSVEVTDVTLQGMKADALEFVEGHAIELEYKSIEVTDVTLQGMKADTLEFVEGEAVGLEQKSVEVTDVTLQGMKADTLEFVEGEAVGLEHKLVEVTDVTLQGMKADTLEFVEREVIGLEHKLVEVTDVTLQGMKADTLEFVEKEAIELEQKSVEVTDVTLQGMKADTLEFVEGEAIELEHKSVEVTDVTLQGMKADTLEFVEGEIIGLEQKSVEVTDVTLQGMKADALEFVEGHAIELEYKSIEVTDVTLQGMKADTLEFVEGEAVGLEQKSVEVTDVTLQGMKADTLEFVEGEAVGLEHKLVEVTDVTLQGMKADTLEFVEGEAVGLEHKSVEVTDVTLQGIKADVLEFVEGEAIGLEQKSVEVTDVTLQGMKADTLEFVEGEAVGLEHKLVEVTDVTLQGIKADVLEFVEGEAIGLEQKSVEVTDVTLQGMKADTLEFVEGEAVGLEHKSVEVTDVTLQGIKADTLEFVEGEAIGLEQKSVEVTDVTLQGMKADTLEFVKGEAIGLEQKSVEVTDVTLPEMKADELEFAEGEAIGLEYKSVEVTDVTLQGMKTDTLEFVEGEAIGLEQKFVEVTDVALQEMKAGELEFAKGEAIGLEQKSVEITDVTLQEMKTDVLEFVAEEMIGLEQKSVQISEVTQQGIEAEVQEFIEGKAIGLEHKPIQVNDIPQQGTKADVQKLTEEKIIGLEQKPANVINITEETETDGLKAKIVEFIDEKITDVKDKPFQSDKIAKCGTEAEVMEIIEKDITFEQKPTQINDAAKEMKAEKMECVEETVVPSKLLDTIEGLNKPPVPQPRRKSKSERRKMSKEDITKWESCESFAESEESTDSFFDYLKSPDSTKFKEEVATEKSTESKLQYGVVAVDTYSSKSIDSIDLTKPPIPQARRKSKSERQKISNEQIGRQESSESLIRSDEVMETASIAESEESAGSFFDYLKYPDSGKLKDDTSNEKTKPLKIQSEIVLSEIAPSQSIDTIDLSKPPVPQPRRKSKSERRKISKENISKWESSESFAESEESAGSFFEYLKSTEIAKLKEDITSEKTTMLNLQPEVFAVETTDTVEDLSRTPVPQARRKSKSNRRKLSKEQISKQESSESLVIKDETIETISIAESEESSSSFFDYLKSPDSKHMKDVPSVEEQSEAFKVQSELERLEIIPPTCLDSAEDISKFSILETYHKSRDGKLSKEQISKLESESFMPSEDITDTASMVKSEEFSDNFFTYLKSSDTSEIKEIPQSKEEVVPLNSQIGIVEPITPYIKDEIDKPPVPVARRRSKSFKRRISKEQITTWESSESLGLSESIDEVASVADSEESAGSYFEYLSSMGLEKHKQDEQSSSLLPNLAETIPLKPTAPRRKSKTLERKSSKPSEEAFKQSKSVEMLSTGETELERDAFNQQSMNELSFTKAAHVTEVVMKSEIDDLQLEKPITNVGIRRDASIEEKLTVDNITIQEERKSKDEFNKHLIQENQVQYSETTEQKEANLLQKIRKPMDVEVEQVAGIDIAESEIQYDEKPIKPSRDSKHKLLKRNTRSIELPIELEMVKPEVLTAQVSIDSVQQNTDHFKIEQKDSVSLETNSEEIPKHQLAKSKVTIESSYETESKKKPDKDSIFIKETTPISVKTEDRRNLVSNDQESISEDTSVTQHAKICLEDERKVEGFYYGYEKSSGTQTLHAVQVSMEEETLKVPPRKRAKRKEPKECYQLALTPAELESAFDTQDKTEVKERKDDLKTEKQISVLEVEQKMQIIEQTGVAQISDITTLSEKKDMKKEISSEITEQRELNEIDSAKSEEKTSVEKQTEVIKQGQEGMAKCKVSSTKETEEITLTPEEKSVDKKLEEIFKEQESKIKKEMSPLKEIQEQKEVKKEFVSTESKEKTTSEKKVVTEMEKKVKQELSPSKEIGQQKEDKKQFDLTKSEETVIEKQKEVIEEKQKETKEKKETLPLKEIESASPKEKLEEMKKEPVLTKPIATIVKEEEIAKQKQKEIMKKAVSPSKEGAEQEAKKEFILTKPEEKTIEKLGETIKQTQEETKMMKEEPPLKKKDEIKELPPKKITEQKEMKQELVQTKVDIEKQEQVVKQKEAKIMKKMSPAKEIEQVKAKTEFVSARKEEKTGIENQNEGDKQKDTMGEKEISLKEIAEHKKLFTTKPEEKPTVKEHEEEIVKQKETKMQKAMSPSEEIAKQKEMKGEFVPIKPEEKTIVEKQEEIAYQKKQTKVKKDMSPPKEKEKATELVIPKEIGTEKEVKHEFVTTKVEEKVTVAKQEEIVKDMSPPKTKEEIRKCMPPKETVEQKEVDKELVLIKPQEESIEKQEKTIKLQEKEKNVKKELLPQEKIVEQKEVKCEFVLTKAGEKTTVEKQEKIIQQEQKKMEKEVSPPKVKEEISKLVPPKETPAQREVKEELVATKPEGKTAVEKQEIVKQKQQEAKIEEISLSEKTKVVPSTITSKKEIEKDVSVEIKEKAVVEKQDKIVKQKQQEMKVKEKMVQEKQIEQVQEMGPIKDTVEEKKRHVKKAVTQSKQKEEIKAVSPEEIKQKLVLIKLEEKTDVEKQEVVKQKQTELMKDLSPPKEKEMEPSEIIKGKKVPVKSEDKTAIEKQEPVKKKQKETKKEVTPPKQKEVTPKEIEQKEVSKENQITEMVLPKLTEEERKPKKEVPVKVEDKTVVELQEDIVKQRQKEEIKEVALSKEITELKEKKQLILTKAEDKTAIKEQELVNQKQQGTMIKNLSPLKEKEMVPLEVTKEKEVKSEYVPIKLEEKTATEEQKPVKPKQEETKIKKVTPPKQMEEIRKVAPETIEVMRKDIVQITPQEKRDREQEEAMKEQEKTKTEVIPVKQKIVSQNIIEQKEEIIPSKQEKTPTENQEEIIKQKQKKTKIKKEITQPKERKISVSKPKEDMTTEIQNGIPQLEEMPKMEIKKDVILKPKKESEAASLTVTEEQKELKMEDMPKPEEETFSNEQKNMSRSAEIQDEKMKKKQFSSFKPEEEKGKPTSIIKEKQEKVESVEKKKSISPPKQTEDKNEFLQLKVNEDTDLTDISSKLKESTEEIPMKKSTEEKGKKAKVSHRVKKRERKASLQANEDKTEEKETISKVSESKISALKTEMAASESEKFKLTNGFAHENEIFEIKQRKIKAEKENLLSQEEMLIDTSSHDDSTAETAKKDELSYSHLRTRHEKNSRRTAKMHLEQEVLPHTSSEDEKNYQKLSGDVADDKKRTLVSKQEEEAMEISLQKERIPSGLPPRPKPRGRTTEKLPIVCHEAPISICHRVYPDSVHTSSHTSAAAEELRKVISVSERLLERRRSRELQRKRFHSLSVERPIPTQISPQSRSTDRTYSRKEHYDTYHIPLSWRDTSRQESQYKSTAVKRDTSKERISATYTSPPVKDYSRYDERIQSSFQKPVIKKYPSREYIYKPSSIDTSFPSRSISPPQAPPRVRKSADHIGTAAPRLSSYTQSRELCRSISKENITLYSKYEPSVPLSVERRISTSSGRDHSVVTIRTEQITMRAFEPVPRWSSLCDVAGTRNKYDYKKSRQIDEPCFVRSTSVRDITAEDERYISAFKRLRQMINEPPQPPPRTMREMRKDRGIHYSSLANIHADIVPTPPPRVRHADYKYIPRTISLRDLEQESRISQPIPLIMNETIRTSREVLRRSSDAKRMYRIASIRERSREPEGRAYKEAKIITKQSSYQPISYSLLDINKQGALYLSDQQDASPIRREGACSSPVLGMYETTGESKHARQRSLTRGRQSRESSRPSSPELTPEIRNRYISPTKTTIVQRSASPMKILRDITETSRPSSPEKRNRYRSPANDRILRRSISPITRLKHICDSDEQFNQGSRPVSPTYSMQERTRKQRYASQILATPTPLFIPGHISRQSSSRRRYTSQDTRRPSITREDEEPMDQATIATKLTEMKFTEEEAFQAAQHCDTIYQAVKFLQQHCDMCDNDFPANQMGAMVYCSHKACQQCLKAFFTTEILDRTVDDLLCPFCEEPDLTDESISHDYFNHLEIMLKNLVDPRIHELFQQKLRDKVLMKNPDFHWCSQCSSGMLSSPEIVKIICPDCKAVTCARCHWLWDPDHDGKSCIEFQSMKEIQSEDVAEGPERQIEGHGIVCPTCHQRYRLAKGDCLQFHCNMCRSFFCSGCRKLYHKGKECEATLFCYKLGWHAHHPRNCLFFLRDKEPKQLQEHLNKNKLPYETQPPQGYTVKERCPVHVQKYSPKGWLPDVCGKLVEEKSFGLCKVHYVEYLVGLINKCILDPVAMMNIDDLKLMLRKSRIPFPERRRDELDSSYRIKLLKIIWQELPLEKIEGS